MADEVLCKLCEASQGEHPDGVHLNAGPTWVCSDCLPDGDLPEGKSDEELVEWLRVKKDGPKRGRRFIAKCVKGEAARSVTNSETGQTQKQNRLAVFIHNRDRSFEHIEVEWEAVSRIVKAMGPAAEVHVWVSLSERGTLMIHGPARPQDW